ncbi:MAG: hypothetical protein R3D68_07090 [Hyphomicrobiaceae bacterium]
MKSSFEKWTNQPSINATDHGIAERQRREELKARAVELMKEHAKLKKRLKIEPPKPVKLKPDTPTRQGFSFGKRITVADIEARASRDRRELRQREIEDATRQAWLLTGDLVR